VKKTQAALAISATVTFALPLVLLWRALVNYMQPFGANDPLRVGVFVEQLSGPTLALLMAFSISVLAVMGKRTPLLLPAVGIASAGWGLFFALKFSHLFSHAAFNECSDRFGDLVGSCFALGICLVLAGAILEWRLRKRLAVGGSLNTEQDGGGQPATRPVSK
jgi:hypothetical protein